jgi:hypothetical protein
LYPGFSGRLRPAGIGHGVEIKGFTSAATDDLAEGNIPDLHTPSLSIVVLDSESKV